VRASRSICDAGRDRGWVNSVCSPASRCAACCCGMVKNHHLARAVSDVGIGIAIRLLFEKAERSGKTVVKIDRWYPSSKMCSHCGHVVEKLPLSIRDWTCAQCSTHHDRDENAAQNILAAGQAVSAHGDGVRAKRTTVRGACCRRSASLQGAAYA